MLGVVHTQKAADLLETPLQLELVLDEVVQPHVRGELGSALSPGQQRGVLVSSPGIVGGTDPTRMLGTAQLSADRRGTALQASSDLADTDVLGAQGLDPLTLEQR